METQAPKKKPAPRPKEDSSATEAMNDHELSAHLIILSAAFDEAPFGVWARDTNDRAILMNKEAIRYWGDLIGKTSIECVIKKTSIESGVHPDVAKAWSETNTRALEGETIREEVEYIKDDKALLFQNIVTPLRINHRIVGILGFLIDITERRRIENALRESEIHLEQCVVERTKALRESKARLNRVFEGSQDGYWEWDVARNQVFLSTRAKQILGLNPDKDPITREDIQHTIHPDDIRQVKESTERNIRSGNSYYEVEHRHCRPDGRIAWIHSRGTITERDHTGMATKVSGVVADITERKYTEEELRNRTHQLAELAAEITLAEQRERRRLADILHNDVQQLLLAARLETETLSSSAHPKPETIAALHSVLNEALSTTRNITQDLAPPVFLHQGLRSAFEWLVRNMHKQYQLEITLHVGQASLYASEAITVLLFTAARELFLNIVKHADTRKAELSFRRKAGIIELEIRDKGKGFDPAKIQAQKERHGFGLFSIRERAELLGGKLTLVSAPCQGTRAILSLPYSQRPKTTSPPPSIASDIAPLRPEKPHKKNKGRQGAFRRSRDSHRARG